MDPRQHRHAASSGLREGILILALLVLPGFSFGTELRGEASVAVAPWIATLTPAPLPPFPPVGPFEATYRFGWEGVGAGGATVRVEQRNGGRYAIFAEGGPNEWVRKLWNYHAVYWGEAGINGETPCWFRMEEEVAKGTFLSEAWCDGGRVVNCHRFTTESKPWNVTEVKGIRDLLAAMLFVRSQPLRDRDRVILTVFPDQGPYLVELAVAGHDTLKILGKKTRAVRFTVRIQRIETRDGVAVALKPHRKFHSGRIWMSEDARRLPLRAEVDVFIGSVFAEVSAITPPL